MVSVDVERNPIREEEKLCKIVMRVASLTDRNWLAFLYNSLTWELISYFGMKIDSINYPRPHSTSTKANSFITSPRLICRIQTSCFMLKFLVVCRKLFLDFYFVLVLASCSHLDQILIYQKTTKRQNFKFHKAINWMKRNINFKFSNAFPLHGVRG